MFPDPPQFLNESKPHDESGLQKPHKKFQSKATDQFCILGVSKTIVIFGKQNISLTVSIGKVPRGT